MTGNYPLHLAAWNGHADVVRVLINTGPSRANVNEQVSYIQTNKMSHTVGSLSSSAGYSYMCVFKISQSFYFVMEFQPVISSFQSVELPGSWLLAAGYRSYMYMYGVAILA